MLGSSALLALAAAQSAPAAPVELPTAEASAPKVKINPTKRVLRFVVPLTDNGNYLGDVDLAVDPNDALSVKAERLLQMLEPVLKPDILERLKAAAAGKDEITEGVLAAEKITLTYDNDKLALAIGIPVLSRKKEVLSLGNGNGPAAATLDPAGFSAFVNFRSAIDLVEHGDRSGIVPPVSAIDWAARAFGVVAEGEAYVSGRKDEPLFRRVGSRLVYDDLHDVIRFTAGDVRPYGRTFQSTPTVAGISASRFYNILEPWQEYRSTGAQSFSVFAPSTVETIVNGRSVELRNLQPGSYNLSDFPLAEGSNDVKLRIRDETGKERLVEFNLYSNRQLLDAGLTEFSAFAGVYSNPTRTGLHYSRDWSVSGFFRRGFNQQLTAGANLQADAGAQQLGGEALFGTPIGLIGFDLAASHRAGGSAGFAAAVSYEKIIGGNGTERQHSIRALVEYRTASFAVPGALVRREPTELRASFGYALTLGLDRYIALDAQYSRDRLEHEQRYSLRASGGLHLGETLAGIAEVQWDHGMDRNGVVARIGLRKRLGFRSTAQVDVDTDGRFRGAFQTSGGRGNGSWSASADVNRDDAGTTVNANGSLVTNRAELGLTQLASYNQGGNRISDIRTSLRAATSIAFAGRHFAIGRPIQDAFLLAEPHSSLKGKSVRVDPQEKSEESRSGTLGPAVEGSLSAYSPRMLLYDVPDAPPGYDLGAGNVEIVPPYKSGYNLKVGSDYHLLVIGRLLDREGQPNSLLAGKAIDLKAPKRAAITMFTSRSGKFGAQGLRPGRWRIEMPTDGGPTIYEIEVKDDPSGTVRMGDLRPLKQGDGR